MKTPLIIYVRALGLYLAFSLPAMVVPYIYTLSAVYAASCSFVALFIFCTIFYLLRAARVTAVVSKVILITIIPLAVGAAYKILIRVIMPDRNFWEMDEFTLFPMAAILSGWVSLYISTPKIKEYFSPSILAEIESISVQP